MSSQSTMASLEDCLERYQEALHRGDRPPLENFLPATPARHPTLVELIHVELEYRLKHGEEATVAGYLERYPELNDDPQAVEELHAAEQKFRRLGPITPTPSPLVTDTLASLRQGSHTPRRFPVVPGYEILGELGRGGMSIVYRAWQHKLNRMVALKMVRGGEQASPGELLRLFSEAETIAKLQHPNIVQIYEIGQHEGLPYLTLELCNAGCLSTYLNGDALPVEYLVPLMTKLARAIHAAHQRGVIHRDLKPGNILFVSEAERVTWIDPPRKSSSDLSTIDPLQPVDAALLAATLPAPQPEQVVSETVSPPGLSELTPKITDFGLAKRVEISWHLTHSNVLIGTPSYMAPEQAGGEGKKVTPAADIYALGAILFEMLTGRPPFKGSTVGDIVMQVLHEDPPSLHQLNPSVPRDLATICLKCLSKTPSQRYESALELAEDLERYQRGEVIRARPTPLWERSWKWTRRHPVASAALLASFVFAVLLVTGLVWHTSTLQGAYDQANRDRDDLRRKLEAHSQGIQDQADNQRYAADMRVGQQLLRYGDLPRLEEILRLHSNPPRLLGEHGFDWHYLSQYRRNLRSDRRAERSEIAVLQVSEDGTRLLTYSHALGSENTHIWPFQDGRIGTALREVTVQPGLGTHGAAALSPDGRWLAYCHPDQRLYLQEVDTGKERVLLDGWPQAVAYSANGQRLAVLRANLDALVLEMPSGKVIARNNRAYASAAAYLAISPDGNRVALCGNVGLNLWTVDTGELRTLFNPTAAARDLRFSRTGRLLASLYDATVYIWDLDQDTLRYSWKVEPNMPRALALSPDETLVATGSNEGQICIWDMHTQQLRTSWRNRTVGISRLAFSPDGNLLASADDSGLVHVQPHQVPPRFHRLDPELNCTGPTAWSPDGRLLAVADAQQKVWLLDAASGQRLRALGSHLGTVNHMVFIRPRQGVNAQLATAHFQDGRVTLWDVEKGTITTTLSPDVRGPLRCLCSLPEGTLFTVTSAGRLHVWNVTTGQTRVHPVSGDVVAVAVAKDGKHLATAGRDRVLRLWGGADWAQALGERTLERNITDLIFSPDGTQIVTNIESATLESWKVATGLPQAGPSVGWEGGGDPEGRLQFSPNGELLVVAGSGVNWRAFEWSKRELRWDGNSHVPLSLVHWHNFTFSPDSKRLAVTRTDGTLQLWTLPFFHVQRPSGQTYGGITGLAFDDDQRLWSSHERPRSEVLSKYRVNSIPVATGRDVVFIQRLREKTADHLHVWQLPTGSEVGHQLQAGTLGAPCQRLVPSPDGRLLAGASEDGSIHLWERKTGAKVARLYVSHMAELETREFELGLAWFTSSRPQYKEGVQSLAFAADSKRLLAQGTRGGLRVWQTADWKLTAEQPPSGVAWAGWLQGARTHTIGLLRDGVLHVWEPDTNHQVATTVGQAGTVQEFAAVSPDGRYIATVTGEQVIQLWDLQGGEMRSLIGHRGDIRVLAFSPRGQLLASGGHDGIVRLWNVAAGQEVAALDGHRGSVTALCFRADGKVLASGSTTAQATGEILLWGALDK